MSSKPTVVPANDAAAEIKPPKGRILIVEDHVDARLVMEEYLEANGFSTSVTKSVDEASALLRAGIAYDVILLDLMLPGRGGLELLDRVRSQHGPVGRTPIVVVSAFAPNRIPGANAVLHKPAPLDTLLETVTRVMRKPPA